MAVAIKVYSTHASPSDISVFSAGTECQEQVNYYFVWSAVKLIKFLFLLILLSNVAKSKTNLGKIKLISQQNKLTQFDALLL